MIIDARYGIANDNNRRRAHRPENADMTVPMGALLRAIALAAPLASVALAAPARADALDDAVLWMTSLGLKDNNAPHTRESAAKLYQLDLGYVADLSKFKPEDLRHADALPKLTTFTMSKKEFDDKVAAEIAKLKRITRIVATGSTMTDKGLADLATMANLEVLHIGGAMNTPSTFTVEGLKALAKMPKLRDIDLSFSSVGDAGLAALKTAPRLGQIYLIGAKNIGRPGLVALAEMKSLSGLVLQWVEVNEEVEALAASTSLQDITFMAAYNSKIVIDDVGAMHLAKIKTLTKVVLWHTKVTDKTMIALATLPKLRTLIISKTAVGDEGFKVFANHAELGTIWAGETQVTDASAAAFAAMKKLSSLSVDSAKMTDAGLVVMAANLNLTSIDVRKTAVTDDGAAKAKAINAKLRVSK